LLVFAEGLVTEEQYVVHWHRRNRGQVTVAIDPFRGPPLQLVERAVEAKKIDERDARRGRGRSYDEIWCIHDVDEHPNLPQAVDLARRHDIQLAVSNPCLELWFLLHFESQTAFIERQSAKSRAEELLGCEKSLNERALALLDERLPVARERAQQLDVKHAGDGSPPGSNPSSSVWRLVESIRTA
jgi:hypothetical protein